MGKYLKYAIGEILLVVIGILIALQINNWNENRKEVQFEQKLLKELKSDFTYNQRELTRNIGKATLLAHNCDSLLVLFDFPDDKVNPDDFFGYVRKLGGYSTYNPSNGALNNLISSGNLNIIKNDSLRTHLARWTGMLEDVKEDEKRLINFGDTQMNPIRLEYLDWDSEYSNVAPIFLSLKFKNIVRTIRNSAYYNVENYETLSTEIIKILDEIKSELDTI
nr:DUF6090 family protein [Allomuricauda sp.]